MQNHFYNVYIGTQDNNSLGGPSRTISSAGIVNSDWLFTNAGDGFETQVDWKDPNIIYSQSQFGGLVRFDKRSGENLYIQPQDFADTAYRFDWDAGFLLSKHDNKRLYMGGNKLMRSDDQGSTWREISPDLTRGVPKEMQKLMGQSWSIDQLARKSAMAQIVTIAESPLDENILFVGSGDGLIHVTTNGGTNWTKASTIRIYLNIQEFITSLHQILISMLLMLLVIIISAEITNHTFTKLLMVEKAGSQSTTIFLNLAALIQLQKITLIKIFYSSEHYSEFISQMMAEKNGYL